MLRAKQPRRIGNRAIIYKRPELHGEEAVPVNVLVYFPVREEISPPERCGAFAAVDGSRSAPQPKIVVALDPKLEQLVEGHITEGFSRAHPRLHLVVVAHCLRKPVRAKRATHRPE